MGQRSQIYFRINKANGGYYLVARYFQWNFGTRMISRARGLLEWLDANSDYPYTLYDENWDALKVVRIIETNFDYKDVCISRDIIADCNDPDYGWDLLFHDDNNDGKFMVDMIVDWTKRDKKGDHPVTLKYAFTDSCNELLMDGEQYMSWNCDREEDDGSVTPWRDSKYIKNEIKYTERNIKKINKLATLMTQEEFKEYLNYDYSKDMGTKRERVS